MNVKLAVLLATLILAGCAPVASVPPAEVQLDAERTSATTIRLTLRNGSRDRVGYNLCASALERRSDGTWGNVPTEDVCTMELRTLAPGASATFVKNPSPALPAGEYRYVTNVEIPLGTQQVGVASDSFTMP